MKSAADIVCEEWQRAVKEFNLRPGSPTEFVVSRILERVRGGDIDLAADNKRLRKALKFYAEATAVDFANDNGFNAEAALDE